MGRKAIIFGGTGYIGAQLAWHLRKLGWDEVLLADIRPIRWAVPAGVDACVCDVRRSIVEQIGLHSVDWIFNLAAVHREPGHQFKEYFDTNIPGAENVCEYAEACGTSNIFFSSSIAVYGEIIAPTNEDTRTYPDTGYGISKLCAELIHEGWQKAAGSRKLIIVRPGVVYGPGEPGNILRMIRAIKKGIFVMPGNGAVRKSYAYIYGLLDSIEFMMARSEPYIRYNYVERETESLSALAQIVASQLGIRRPGLRIPKSVLVGIAKFAQFASAGRSSIHPVRVRKASQSTHIVPAELIRLGFEFRYGFVESLRHWMSVAPEDFAPEEQVRL